VVSLKSHLFTPSQGIDANLVRSIPKVGNRNAPNEACLQLHVLASNLGNFLRRLAPPPKVDHCTLTTLREKLIKIGAKAVRHARHVTFQIADPAAPPFFYRGILRRIARLRELAVLPPM
jgi:hypothetical protein